MAVVLFTVILEPKKIKSVTVSTFPPSIFHEVMGLGASQMVLVVKNLHANAGDARKMSLIPESWRSPGGGNGNLLQYSCLENPMGRGAWWLTVHAVAKSQHNWVTEHSLHGPHNWQSLGHRANPGCCTGVLGCWENTLQSRCPEPQKVFCQSSTGSSMNSGDRAMHFLWGRGGEEEGVCHSVSPRLSLFTLSFLCPSCLYPCFHSNEDTSHLGQGHLNDLIWA